MTNTAPPLVPAQAIGGRARGEVVREFRLVSAISTGHSTVVTDISPIRVLVADDHSFLREGIRAVIETQPGLVVVAEASNGYEAINQYREHLPDVVLMDLQMPKLNGVDAIAGIRQEWPDARIVVLTTSAGDAQALRALRAGAAGYLLKNSLRNELIDTIKSVRRGGKHLDPQVAAGMSLQVAGDALSERETTVLSLAANGNSNRQIANRLGLTEVTEKNYMKTIFLKLSASDRTHAVTIAAKRGIIEL